MFLSSCECSTDHSRLWGLQPDTHGILPWPDRFSIAMASSSMGTQAAGPSELSASANVFELGKKSHSVRVEDVVEIRTVAMWNLDHAYTAETLRAYLFEVDFVPEEIILHDIRGQVWQIVMPTAAMAMAMQTVFNEIDPEEKVLKPSQDDTGTPMPVRVVQWGEVGIPRSPKKTVSTKPPVSFGPATSVNFDPSGNFRALLSRRKYDISTW